MKPRKSLCSPLCSQGQDLIKFPGALTVTKGVKVGSGLTLLVGKWPVSHAHPASRGLESNTVADRRPHG